MSRGIEFNRQTLEKTIAISLLLAGSLYVVWAVHPIWRRPWLNDDSFITLTYAKNLISGNGFVYNHPPATLGTTTPLFTLLTAWLALLIPGLDVIKSAIILSVAPWIGTGILLYLVATHLNLPPLSGVVVAVMPLVIVNGLWLWFIGMEIWLFQFLLVLSFYLSLTERPTLAGVTVGLLFLTRGEGALVGAILAGYLFVVKKRLPFQFIAASAAIVAIWALYAFLTFGTMLPNTLAAKVAHREFLAAYGRGDSFLHVMGVSVPGWIASFNLGSTLFSNIFLVSILIGLLVVLHKRQSYWSFFLIWGTIYFIGYAIINPSTYPWYALHFYFIFEVMAGLGAAWLLNIARNLVGTRQIAMTILAGTLTLLLIVPGVIRGIASVETFAGDQRAPVYMAIANWLNQNTRPDDSFAFIEIGYLGYYSQNRIIDLAGLTDPLIASNIAAHGFTWGFWHYQPDYFLFNPGMDTEAYLAGIRSAATQYQEVARFPGGPDGLPLVLFQRIDNNAP